MPRRLRVSGAGRRICGGIKRVVGACHDPCFGRNTAKNRQYFSTHACLICTLLPATFGLWKLVSPKHIGPHNKNRKPPKLRQTLPACRSQFEPCCPSRWVHGNGGFYSTFETTSAKQMIQFHGTLPPSPPYFNPWGHQPSFMGTEVHRANGASSPRKKTDSPISPGSQSSPDHIFEPLGPPPFVHGNGGVRSASR